MSTGVVQDPTGRSYNLTLVGNTDQAKRTYQAMVTNFNYRLSRSASRPTTRWPRCGAT